MTANYIKVINKVIFVSCGLVSNMLPIAAVDCKQVVIGWITDLCLCKNKVIGSQDPAASGLQSFQQLDVSTRP